MLHAILLILKIIGILLLILIGLILLILLTVLLVPIRYRVAAEHGEELRVEGRAGWLLHLINAKFSHIEGIFHVRVRVLWFVLYDNLKPKQAKNKEQKSKAIRRKKAAQRKKAVGKPKVASDKPDAASEMPIPSEDRKASSETMISGIESKDSQTQEEVRQPDREEAQRMDIKQSAGNKKEKKSILKRISDAVKAVKEKMKAFFIGIKNRFLKWFETISGIKNKINLISDFIHDEINREGFKITYKSLKKLLKQILPRKLKSRIVFGTGDPCTTGQALGLMGILYSFYGDKVQIIPDFENKRFEGKHYARGRIRLVTILIIVIKLILDKRFKQLKENFLILKEAL